MGPESIHAEFQKHFNAGNIDGLISLYSEEAVFSPEPGKVVQGRDAIREAMGHFLALKAAMEISTRFAMQSGDTALLSCIWSIRGEGPDGPINMSSTTAEVVRRNADGRWVYLVDNAFAG